MHAKRLLAALPCCAGCGPTDPTSAFCLKLGSKSPCDQSTASKCLQAIDDGKKADGTCAPFIDRLVACGAGLDLSCTGTSSISVVGDGKFNGGQNFTVIAGYDVVVNDSKCDVYRRGLEACRTCPTAVGAKEVEALGVGDKCSAASSPACATGLACEGGLCTKGCSADADCDARADGCRLQVQSPNVCRSGKCTRGCSGDFSCQAWVGTSSTCINQGCSLP